MAEAKRSLDDLLDPPAHVEPDPPAEAEGAHHAVEAAKLAPEPEPEPEPVVAAIAPTPEPEQTPAPVAPLPVKRGIPRGWYDIGEAPEDGKFVVLLGPDDPADSREFPYTEAFWKHTRAWDRNGGKWREVGFWAVRNCAGLKVPFEPMGWRPAL